MMAPLYVLALVRLRNAAARRANAYVYICMQFLHSAKGNENLPASFPRNMRRKIRNLVCALLAATFAARIAESYADFSIALALAAIGYWNVSSMQQIKKQLFRMVSAIEDATERSLPKDGGAIPPRKG